MNISVSVREQYPCMKGLYGRPDEISRLLHVRYCSNYSVEQLLQESMHVSRLKRYIFELVSRPLLKPEFFVFGQISARHIFLLSIILKTLSLNNIRITYFIKYYWSLLSFVFIFKFLKLQMTNAFLFAPWVKFNASKFYCYYKVFRKCEAFVWKRVSIILFNFS